MKRVLFLCTGNSCRSQLAEVVLNHFGKGRFEALSAGSKPTGTVHPFAIQTLKEAHMSVEGLRSKPWEEFQGRPFDFVITVCDRAKESCPIWPGQPVTAHWGFEDPAEAQGTDDEKRRIFRKVFTEIQRRIQLFLAIPVDKLTYLELQKEVRQIGEPAADR